jgi:Ca2+/H+ antiporter, TMEM165/GDT1 family
MDWSLFVTIFTVIFIAELPDKTALAILLMASHSHPLAVFSGVTLAYIVQSLVAVLFGSLFAFVPQTIVHIFAGVLFIVFGVLMWIKKEDEMRDPAEHEKKAPSFLTVARRSFVVIFIAEWGDLTQLATATFQAQHRAPLTVFIAATTALMTASGLIVIVGHHSKKIIKPALMQKIGAVAFTIIGIVMLLQQIFHR